MPVVSVHLTDEESKLVERYCAKHGMSLSDAFKTALIEKIEDEYDLAQYEAAKKRYDKNPVSFSLNEARKELNVR